ncbi:hypothetical protein K435DRAFT_796464 [Dendrothele bispora CBS 962.96]|uniref:Uncharacterized protein n=1 Tax=Dendrothele bispora (strain CBS 962.96) TaxID=1314807 RepID=A0A4S8M609_DENBC|nr:hypothetical protein K435DRAFT_796464 [Dendrothele bispora CBS 962.96]
MDDRRAHTLEALSTFIQAQKALLARTQNDLGRLKELRSKAQEKPDAFVDSWDEEVSSFRLSEQVADCYPVVPKGIDWTLYANHDPSPFHTLLAQPRIPATSTISSATISPSILDLQKYVKTQRTSILEPVFAKFDLSFDPPPPEPPDSNSNSQTDPLEGGGTKKRTKILPHHHKRRRNTSGACNVASGGITPSRGRGGLFIRKDKALAGADENMHINVDVVDMNMVASPPPMSASTTIPETPLSTTSTLPPSTPCLPMALSKTSRVRRPTIKASALGSGSGSGLGSQPSLRRTSISSRTRNKSFSSHVQVEIPMDVDPPPSSAFKSKSLSPSTTATSASSVSIPTPTSLVAAAAKTLLSKPKPLTITIPSKKDRERLAASRSVSLSGRLPSFSPHFDEEEEREGEGEEESGSGSGSGSESGSNAQEMDDMDVDMDMDREQEMEMEEPEHLSERDEEDGHEDEDEEENFTFGEDYAEYGEDEYNSEEEKEEEEDGTYPAYTNGHARPCLHIRSNGNSSASSTRRSSNHRHSSFNKPNRVLVDNNASSVSQSASDVNSSPTNQKLSKPKPDTYKQAWSVSEQHLLEKLLLEIPEGEKNRWKKISTAMDGRRTPRQVASRVQKYFEKLKRYGVGVE